MDQNVRFDAEVIEKIAAKTVLNLPGVLATQGSALDRAMERRLEGNKQQAERECESLVSDSLAIEALPKEAERGVTCEMGEVEVSLSLRLVVEYGSDVQSIYKAILEKVPESIFLASGYRVAELHVHIEDMVKKADYQKVYYKQF